MFKSIHLIKHFVFIAVLASNAQLWSQDYTFRNLNQQDGICDPFTYAFAQDKNGYLWISTGEGLCLFDGIEFHTPPADSISSAIVNVIFKDSKNTIWFGHNDGAISFYDGLKVRNFDNNLQLSSAIKGIAEVNGSLVFATLTDGIILKYGSHLKQLKEEFLDKTPSSVFGIKNKLYIGAQEGLFVYKMVTPDSIAPMYTPEELEYVNVQSFALNTDSLSVWVGTEDMGIYILSTTENNYFLKKVGEDIGLDYENIQHILHTPNQELWLSTYNGVYKIKTPEVGHSFKNYLLYNTTNGLKTNFIKQVFLDFEDNVWFASYGEGIDQLLDESLVIYPPEALNFQSDILCVESADSLVYLGGEGTITIFSTSKKEIVTQLTTANGLPDSKITSIYYERASGLLWFGTSDQGVYRIIKNKAQKFFSADNSLGNKVNDIIVRGADIVMATENGIYIANRETNLVANLSTTDGIPYNNISALLLNDNDQILIATRSNGLFALNENYQVILLKETANVELDIKDLAYDKDGNIWAATYLNGVIGFLGDSLVNITKTTGLINNYCYSITADKNNNIWLGHRSGISKVNLDNYQIKVFTNTDGINGSINIAASTLTSDNILLFGSTKGLISYNMNSEKVNTTPPFANIVQVEVSDEMVDFHKTIELPYDAYKLRIDFLGINLTDPTEVAYQYKLDGYDLEWSEITDLNYVIYPRIEDGEYTFLLKAYNNQGYSNVTPATFSIFVQKPIWKRWWFIVTQIVLVIFIVIFIIKYRERKQKELQEYLQRSLDERTREVVEQKEEIELKNRDITDSINYAQRIQESILPPIKKLQDNFSGSFVYYQPRDIVSGDFYWFDNVGNDRFIIVCADSTGHGVPGAFMSMIGTTLIKDICMRKSGNETPSKILNSLDFELSQTLNQNVDAEKPSDGMDIVVCELDLKTNYLSYASAMRPMILYKDGEQNYIRGSRSSIGGQYSKDAKDFEDGGIQLTKGDIVYMFSDGYPDQFGGPMGKKFKMVRMKNLLRDIHQKPMEEQYNYVKSTFNLWKEDLEQVDDVLFMGLKI